MEKKEIKELVMQIVNPMQKQIDNLKIELKKVKLELSEAVRKTNSSYNPKCK